MVRLEAVIDRNADDRSAASDDTGPGPWRLLLAALGTAAAAVYLLLRWRRGDSTAIDALPERLTDEAEDVLENAERIEIGEPSDADEGESDASEEGEADDAPSLDAPTSDRSAEEIAERTESDIQEEPAEPGEMAIDEEVADEVVDEDETESGR